MLNQNAALQNRWPHSADPPSIVDTLSYASRRRDHIIDAILLAARERNVDVLRSSDVFEIINRLHSAAVIIDDLLDCESFRRGMPVFHKRYSSGVAAIGALYLVRDVGRRIKARRKRDAIEDRIDLLVEAELADVGQRQRLPERSPLSWYTSVSARKTAEELLIAYDLIFDSDDEPILMDALDGLGLLLQASNDKADVLGDDPFRRLGPDDPFVFTYSLPLAMVAEHVSPGVEAMVGLAASRDEAMPTLDLLRRFDIRAACREHVEKLTNSVVARCEAVGGEASKTLLSIASEASDGSFWQ